MTQFIGVPPSRIKIGNGLIGSDLGNSEKETVACNIIIISRRSGDSWASFSWEDYVAGCAHSASGAELDILNNFVEDKLLSFLDDRYVVLDAFIAKLWKFVDC